MDHRIKKANRKKKKNSSLGFNASVMNWRWIMYISVTGRKI